MHSYNNHFSPETTRPNRSVYLIGGKKEIAITPMPEELARTSNPEFDNKIVGILREDIRATLDAALNGSDRSFTVNTVKRLKDALDRVLKELKSFSNVASLQNVTRDYVEKLRSDLATVTKLKLGMSVTSATGIAENNDGHSFGGPVREETIPMSTPEEAKESKPKEIEVLEQRLDVVSAKLEELSLKAVADKARSPAISKEDLKSVAKSMNEITADFKKLRVENPYHKRAFRRRWEPVIDMILTAEKGFVEGVQTHRVDQDDTVMWSLGSGTTFRSVIPGDPDSFQPLFDTDAKVQSLEQKRAA